MCKYNNFMVLSDTEQWASLDFVLSLVWKKFQAALTLFFNLYGSMAMMWSDLDLFYFLKRRQTPIQGMEIALFSW